MLITIAVGMCLTNGYVVVTAIPLDHSAETVRSASLQVLLYSILIRLGDPICLVLGEKQDRLSYFKQQVALYLRFYVLDDMDHFV